MARFHVQSVHQIALRRGQPIHSGAPFIVWWRCVATLAAPAAICGSGIRPVSAPPSSLSTRAATVMIGLVINVEAIDRVGLVRAVRLDVAAAAGLEPAEAVIPYDGEEQPREPARIHPPLHPSGDAGEARGREPGLLGPGVHVHVRFSVGRRRRGGPGRAGRKGGEATARRAPGVGAGGVRARLRRGGRRTGPRGAERARPAREWLYNRAFRRTGAIAGAEPSLGTDRPGHSDRCTCWMVSPR